VVILEFILTFPIVIIVSVAILEFMIIGLVQQVVVAASIEGARAAAVAGATTTDAATVMNNITDVIGINFSTTGVNLTNQVRVEIEGGPAAGSRGNTSIPCVPVGPPPGPDETRVTICMEMTDALGLKPVPDLLQVFNFSIAGARYELSARQLLE
jgi:hypothetical protein